MRITILAAALAALGLGACTTVVPPSEPVVVSTPRPATTYVVPGKTVVQGTGTVFVPAQ
jgi:hypothetical protein